MVRRDRLALKGTVEVDESYFGGVAAGAGRGAAGKTLVAIAVEDYGSTAGRVRMERIPDASQKTLEGFVRRNVQPGSTVKTDGWPA